MERGKKRRDLRHERRTVMQDTSMKLNEIKKKLSRLPEHKLDEVSDFIGFVLSREKKKKKTIVQLEGIWEGKGFEKLDLDKELRAVRKEVEKSILKRKG